VQGGGSPPPGWPPPLLLTRVFLIPNRWKTLRQIGRIGIITEQAPPLDDTLRLRDREVLGRALCIRAIDPRSCNGCELEIHALDNPLYSLEWHTAISRVGATGARGEAREPRWVP